MTRQQLDRLLSRIEREQKENGTYNTALGMCALEAVEYVYSQQIQPKRSKKRGVKKSGK